MVQKVVFLASSLKDLENIRIFIAADSDFQAEKFINTLVSEALKIGKIPEGGGIVREFGNPFIRQRLFKKYRIIYLLKKYQIEILTFHHSAMLLQNNPHLKDYI